MVHVVVAPDKFKGSLTAAEVAATVAEGIGRVRPELTVRQVPIADGGDGTVAAALAAGYRRVDVPVSGPTGEPVTAPIAVRGDLAVIESAAACGLSALPGGRLAPLTATSYGVGELLLAAVTAGCRTAVVGVGGSACTDGGAGLVQALGGRLLDETGEPIPPGGAALNRLATVDLSGLDSRLAGLHVILACDVDNPLHGPHGAAAVFGPQKGANPDQVRLLERGLRRWSTQVTAALGRDDTEVPGAGAAGGIGFAALAVLGAERRSGIELMLDLVGFHDQLDGARLVITGEGSLDRQTLHGKAPVGVVAAARAAGIPAVAIAGRCLLTPDELAEAGIAAGYALTDLEPDPDRCMADAERLLGALAERVATDWLAADPTETAETTVG